MVRQYNQSVDVAKGSLIFLVILGHVLYGSLTDNVIRFFIYSFHMPLFLFISGYLINIDKLCSRSILSLIKHYFHRMLFAWFLACIVYTAYDIYKNISFDVLIDKFIHPWFHLWYIPSLFIMIVIVYSLNRLICKKRLFYLIIVILGVATLIIGCLYNYPSICRLSYFVYFVFGLILRNSNTYLINVNNVSMGWIQLSVLYVVITLINFRWVQNENVFTFYQLIQFPLLTFSLCVFYPILKEDRLPFSPILACWGRHSLSIYLWHMVPVIIIKHFCGDTNHILFYSVCFLLMVIFTLSTKYVIKKTRK